jgi:hypothetical protein
VEQFAEYVQENFQRELQNRLEPHVDIDILRMMQSQAADVLQSLHRRFIRTLPAAQAPSHEAPGTTRDTAAIPAPDPRALDMEILDVNFDEELDLYGIFDLDNFPLCEDAGAGGRFRDSGYGTNSPKESEE